VGGKSICVRRLFVVLRMYIFYVFLFVFFVFFHAIIDDREGQCEQSIRAGAREGLVI
jgi:hypothetical protein